MYARGTYPFSARILTFSLILAVIVAVLYLSIGSFKL